MKKNVKKSLLAGAVLATVLAGGLSSVQAAENGFADGTLSYSDYNKLHDYLIEVTLNDYNYNQYLQNRGERVFGACSVVYNENYFGRNFDFPFDDTVQAMVRVPAAEGRFASIGIGDIYSQRDNLSVRLNVLSYVMNDGINENGVAVCWNVYDQINAKAHGGFIPDAGTNPGKPELSLVAVVRYVLDNAKSAEQIVNVLKNDVNIVCNDVNDSKDNYGMHFMIADKNKHYIVEFVNNQVVVSEDTVMTNFFNTLHDKAIAEEKSDVNGIETFVKDGEDTSYRQEYPMGVERYKILKQYYDEGKISMQKMAELMQRVKYSQVYDPNISKEKYFYSEDVMPPIGGTGGKSIQAICGDRDAHYNTMKAYYEAMWAGKTWEDLRGSEYGLWQTMNTSVYDLNKLKLLLYIQEEYDRAYNFSLTVQDIMGVGSRVAGNNVLTALYQGEGESAGSKFVQDIVNSTTYIDGTPTMGKTQAAKMLNGVGNMGEAAGVLHGTVAMLNSFNDNICSQMSLTNRPSFAEGVKTEKKIWADYIHSKEKVDGLALYGIDANYDMQINGFTVGAELWNHKNNLGGVAIMYASGNTNGFSGGVSTRNDMDYYGIGLYNRKDFRNNWSILYDLNYTHGKNDIRQHNYNQEITASPKTNSFSVGVRAEKMFGDAKGQISPFVGLRYNMINSGGYSNNLGIDYDTSRMNVFNVPVGIKFSCATRSGGWSFSPYAEVAYIRNFGDTDNRTEMSLGGVSDSFGYDVLDKGAWSVKAGIAMAKDNLSFHIGYNHVKSSNSRNNRWHIGLNVSF